MKFPGWLLPALAIAISPLNGWAQASKATPPKPPSQKIDAQALLKEIVGKRPSEMMEILGTLRIRGADDRILRIPMKWTVRPGTNEWFDAYQTPANGPIPSETLIITHREDGPNQYEFRRDEKAVPGAATNIFMPFATSDFWLGDLGLEFLHWPNPNHITNEMRKGRACHVIETQNPRPNEGPYSRVVSWIDTEQGGLIRAEAYDWKNKLLKEFHIGNIAKVNGRWQIKELVIRNDQTDTNTRLEFNLEVADK